jgi:hypothetical protein
MGKYGTNLEGFGGFEGGVNADKGAPLVSTSSDGETALLFGSAALREIQAGVANGDFAIPPDAAGDNITESNPLPYWTVSTTGSTCSAAIVADANQGSGNALRVTVGAGSGGSITLTRYIPLPGTRAQTFSAQPVITLGGASNQTDAEFYASGTQFNANLVSIALTTVTLNTLQFNSYTTTKKKLLPDSDQLSTWKNTAVAPDAAFYKITLVFQNAGTTAAPRTIDVYDVRLILGSTDTMVAESVTPATYGPGWIRQESGVLKIQSDVSDGSTKTISLSSTAAALPTTTATSLTINGANSLWLARIAYTTTQSLVNNTSTKIAFNTASATPDIGSYDPKGWFNNANDSIDIGQDGFYCVTANLAFAANTTGIRTVAIVVNGTSRGAAVQNATSASTPILSVSTNLYLVFGDQITVTGLQTSGGALNTANVAGVYPALSVGRIGA